MPEFKYVAKNVEGQVVHDTIIATSRIQALSELKSEGLTVVDLFGDEHQEREIEEAAPIKHSRWGFSSRRVNANDLAVFCRQLSISVNAGMPLTDALHSIARDAEHPGMRRILGKILEDLSAGQPFSETLSHHPQVFSRLFVSMIRAAEEAGSMPTTLNDLSRNLLRNLQLQRKVKTITAYPIFVMGFFMVVCVIMTVFVIPRFADIFKDLNSELPPLTRTVFSLNQFLLHNALWICGGAALFVLGFILLKRSKAGRVAIDRLKLRLPMFGNWVRLYSLARSCRSLAIMLKGGVPITAAMDVSARVTGNEILREGMIRARDRVVSGSDVASSLSLEKEYPRLVTNMISVGESSGRLPDVLSDIADMYEEQVESSIMVAMALFEPLVICVFGAIILVLVMAIYLPIFSVAQNV